MNKNKQLETHVSELTHKIRLLETVKTNVKESDRFVEDFKNKYFQEQERSRNLQSQVTNLNNELNRLEGVKKFFEQSYNDQKMNQSQQEI